MTGAYRVATVLQVVALFFTAVVVLLTPFSGLSNAAAADAAVFSVQTLASEALTVAALLVSLDVTAFDMSGLIHYASNEPKWISTRC